MITRLAQSEPRGWRILRWVGRLVALLACWPAWYAFFGKPGFDASAAVVGFPGLVGGLALWLKAGHRIRNPWKTLEIDRAAGVARLREGPVAVAVSPLAALTDWSIRSFVVTTRTKHGTTQSTWYAVRCAGFGTQDLYTDDNQASCRRFIHAAEAAAFPFDSTGWKFSEGVLGTVMKRHGLRDRDALLWAASRLDEGKRYLNEAELEAAARGLSEVSVGDRVGALADRALGGLRGQPVRGLLVAATAGLGWAVWRLVWATGDIEPAVAVVLALGLAVLALGWRGAGQPLVGLGVALGGAGALVGKPWIAPLTHTWMGVTQAFSPSSETHLYFIVPGIGLGVVALVLVAGLRLRRPV